VRERIQADMARARLVVDPEVIKPADHFIATIGDAVRLESANVDVDLDRFFEHAQTGLDLWKRVRNEAARRDLERAEASYAGDFLEEDLYEDWAASVRDEARALYTAVTGALAELADATHDDEAAIRYRLRILERDPYDESAHLGTVTAMFRIGRHGEAHRAYRDYVARMKTIAVEPAPFPSRQ
jgi:DNA-binding SARP family transcriptional activator